MGGADGGRARVAEKTLYWWSVHLERFLKFCRYAGAESSEIPEVAAGLFLESLPVGGSAQDFAREQARMALDVFIGEMVGCFVGRRSVWAGGAEIPVEDEFGRVDHRGHNRKGWGASEEEQLKVGPKGRAERERASQRARRDISSKKILRKNLHAFQRLSTNCNSSFSTPCSPCPPWLVPVQPRSTRCMLKCGLGVSFSEARTEASSDGFEGTSVECEAGTGDVGCGVGEEKRCGFSKFGDVSVAAHGNRLYGICAALFRRHPGAFGARAVQAPDAVGIDPTGHDVVYPDAFWGELDGERLDQTCYAGSHDI